jgi:hypothetical protein
MNKKGRPFCKDERHKMEWKEYGPEWLAKLAERQQPDAR